MNSRSILMICGAVAAAVATHASAAGAAVVDAGETARNRAVVTAFSDMFYRRRDPRLAFETYVAPDYVQHNPMIGDGREAAIAALTPLFSRPGGHFDVKQIVVDGDLAVVRLLGAPDASTGPLAVFDMYRLAHGKIVEHWDAVQPIPTHSANPHPMF